MCVVIYMPISFAYKYSDRFNCHNKKDWILSVISKALGACHLFSFLLVFQPAVFAA